MVKIKQMEMSKRNEIKGDNVQMAKIQALMKQIAEKKDKKSKKEAKKEQARLQEKEPKDVREERVE